MWFPFVDCGDVYDSVMLANAHFGLSAAATCISLFWCLIMDSCSLVTDSFYFSLYSCSDSLLDSRSCRNSNIVSLASIVSGHVFLEINFSFVSSSWLLQSWNYKRSKPFCYMAENLLASVKATSKHKVNSRELTKETRKDERIVIDLE